MVFSYFESSFVPITDLARISEFAGTDTDTNTQKHTYRHRHTHTHTDSHTRILSHKQSTRARVGQTRHGQNTRTHIHVRKTSTIQYTEFTVTVAHQVHVVLCDAVHTLGLSIDHAVRGGAPRLELREQDLVYRLRERRESTLRLFLHFRARRMALWRTGTGDRGSRTQQ